MIFWKKYKIMKSTIFLFFLTFILLPACNDDEQIAKCEDCNFTCLDENESDVFTNECKGDWECTFKVFPDSKVEISEYGGQITGDENVFQMIVETQGDEAITDDEVS